MQIRNTRMTVLELIISTSSPDITSSELRNAKLN